MTPASSDDPGARVLSLLPAAQKQKGNKSTDRNAYQSRDENRVISRDGEAAPSSLISCPGSREDDPLITYSQSGVESGSARSVRLRFSLMFAHVMHLHFTSIIQCTRRGLMVRCTIPVFFSATEEGEDSAVRRTDADPEASFASKSPDAPDEMIPHFLCSSVSHHHVKQAVRVMSDWSLRNVYSHFSIG